MDNLLPSHINDELEAGRRKELIWRAKLLMTTEEKPIIMWELDPGISNQQETYATCYFNGAVKVNKPSWCGVTSQVAEQEN
ncbi:hypothetical protein AVEN_176831-1 [Araneus ventricosus]|uniref:Uncharacterized protein n=1 Tax=Araneus ventricosus TaxID=182803 RepID=A0A4Y2P357_ARAVE|nr:hypothetical protein AVEN_176831-1 [Araneus ventricosus]